MQRSDDDVPVLVAQTGPLNGQRWPLHGQLVVGRDITCDIVVPDRQVSRQHALITPTAYGVTLEDLGSKNGTHYNGQPLHGAAALQDGDVIQIALAQQFVFLNSDATLPLDMDEVDLQAFKAGAQANTGAQTPGSSGASAASRGGRLRLDKRSRRVWIGAQEVLPPLSVSQFRLLDLLYEHQGRVVSRQELIAEVWGEEQAIEVSEQALDALVRRLRDRLASIDPTHVYINTVRGHGLRLDNPQA